MKHVLIRLLAVCLCVCMLPLSVLAEDINDGTPVTRSDFSAELNLYADGFPADGAAHYEDWQTFLDKITFEGVVDAQSWPMPASRVYMDADVLLNGREVLPFEYDAYHNYRYVRSPAFRGESVHFQMFNFFQFMLKGYYFMGLPTQLIGVPLYPEAAIDLFQRYVQPIREVCAGEESRTVSYDELYELATQLSAIAIEDDYSKVYYFFTCLFIDIGADYVALEKLSYVEDWLDYLDPEQQGLSITVDGDTETWVLGETTVYEKTPEGFTVNLPDYEGYVFSLEGKTAGSERSLHFLATLEEETRLDILACADGVGDALHSQGTATLAVTGEALWQEFTPLSFQYRYNRTAEALPYDMTLEVDWLHPATGKPAVGFACAASCTQEPHTAVYDRPITNQEDLFHLNEGFMAELQERYLPTLALAAAPFVMELPAGIISDVVAWMDATGFLAFLGIE